MGINTIENGTAVDFQSELLREYLADSFECLKVVEADLLTIERNGASSEGARTARALGLLRSVKSGAGLFQLSNIRMLASKSEHAVALIQSGRAAPGPARITLLLRAVDVLRDWIAHPERSIPADITDVLDGLNCERALPVSAAPRRMAGKLRTLLVEDDFASRLLLQTVLARYGDCHIAVNGREAVEAIRRSLEGERYDLICMDIMMPEMDGREAVHQIRALEEARNILPTHGAKIIMTTALNDLKEVIHCFRELCDGYLVKPVELARLLDLMKSYDLIPSQTSGQS